MKLSMTLLVTYSLLSVNMHDLALLDQQLAALDTRIVNDVVDAQTAAMLEQFEKNWKKQLRGPVREPQLTESDLRDISKLPKNMQPQAIQAILERKRKEIEEADLD